MAALEFIIALLIIFGIGMLIRRALKKRNANQVNSTTFTNTAPPSPMPKSSAFCSQCGQPVSGDSAFCSSCGAKIK